MVKTFKSFTILHALVASSLFILLSQAAPMLGGGGDSPPPNRPYQAPGGAHYDSFSPATGTNDPFESELSGNWMQGTEYDPRYREWQMSQGNQGIPFRTTQSSDPRYNQGLYRGQYKKGHESMTLPPIKTGHKKKGFLSKLTGKFAMCGPGGTKLASPRSEKVGASLSRSNSGRSSQGSPPPAPQQDDDDQPSFSQRILQRGYSIGAGSSSQRARGKEQIQGTFHGQNRGMDPRFFPQYPGQQYEPSYNQMYGQGQGSVDDFFAQPYKTPAPFEDYGGDVEEPRRSFISKDGQEGGLNAFYGVGQGQGGSGMLEDVVSKAMSGVYIQDQPTGHRRSHSHGSAFGMGGAMGWHPDLFPQPPLTIGSSSREGGSGIFHHPQSEEGFVRRTRKQVSLLKRERRNAPRTQERIAEDTARRNALKRFMEFMRERGSTLSGATLIDRFEATERDWVNDMMNSSDPQQEAEAAGHYNTMADGSIFEDAVPVASPNMGPSGTGSQRKGKRHH